MKKKKMTKMKIFGSSGYIVNKTRSSNEDERVQPHDARQVQHESSSSGTLILSNACRFPIARSAPNGYEDELHQHIRGLSSKVPLLNS